MANGTVPGREGCVKVEFRFTREEAEGFRRTASGSGYTLAGLVKDAALGRRLPAAIPEVNRELFAELVRVGGSLNSIAQAQELLKAPDVLSAIARHEELLVRLEAELLGGGLE